MQLLAAHPGLALTRLPKLLKLLADLTPNEIPLKSLRATCTFIKKTAGLKNPFEMHLTPPGTTTYRIHYLPSLPTPQAPPTPSNGPT